MSVTIADLASIPSISADDLLHILDVSNSNEDHKTTVDDVAEWIITNKNIEITGISDVPGLQAALDGKSDVGHTHTIQQIVGLSSALDLKLNSDQANIVGRIVNIKGVAITVPDEITGVRDDRIPDTVIIGEYLQFDAADGGINNISGDTLKTNLSIDLVDNTSDASKPISTATQIALDLKVDTTDFNTIVNTFDAVHTAFTASINTNTTAIALNTQKVSFDAVSSAKLDGIEALADVTDTENVWGSLGISGSGSTGQYLTQRGVFVGAPNVSVNKSQIDAAIGASPGGNTTLFYNQAGAFTAPEGGDDVTKQAIDNAIGVFPTGDSAQFYNEQGNFIDAVYDSVEDAPIIRNRTIESIVISGTRSNVQARETGTNETSTITMLDAFDPAPTQYTSIFTSPNTSFTPALVLPTGSQGRQLSLTEADGTVHRFGYTTNGNYRLLAGGLTGTLRLGPVAVATTATVTAAVSVPDQTAGQTITLVGDETGTFAVGDFISPQANNFGAYRGIFIDSITFDGTNTVIVGPSNGATTFNTTSVLRNAGFATEVQGVSSTFSYDPDTADEVYSTDVTNQAFTSGSVGITAHLTQIANTIVELDTAITWDGIITPTTLLDSILPVGFGNIYSNSLTAGNTWRFLFSNASVTIPDGTEWTSATFNNVFIEGDFSSFTAPTGTTVRLTLPNGSWVEWQTTVTDVYAADSGRFFISSISNSSGTVAGCNAFGLSTQLQLEAPADASSITIDLGTESNINSSFTVTGGLNNMESVVNVDGAEGALIPATTITVIDPEATEVASFTASVVSATDNDVDDIAAQIVTAVNNNTETPIDFTAEYDSATTTVILTASRAGNTNPWTIVFNNNGVTGINAGNLGSTSSQTGEIINQIQTISVIDPIPTITTFSYPGVEGGVRAERITSVNDSTSGINIDILNSGIMSMAIRGNFLLEGLYNGSLDRTTLGLGRDSYLTTITGSDTVNIQSSSSAGFMRFSPTTTTINESNLDRDFTVNGTSGNTGLNYNAGTDTLTTDAANVIGFGGGADGLSITDTVNLNLLQGATVLSTVVLPSAGGTTIIAGTANEIINTVSGNTNTLSLAPAITDAITANTAKTGITTAQASAITTNTAKTGITTVQAAAITTNTGKTGITAAQASAIIANTAKVSNVDILPLNNTFTGVNTFNNAAGGIQTDRITAIGDADTYIGYDFTNVIQFATNNSVIGEFSATGGGQFSTSGAISLISGTLLSGLYAGLNNGIIQGSATTTEINSSRLDRDLILRKVTTGDALVYDAGADTLTFNTTINGLPSKADALSVSGQVLSLLDGTTVLDTVTLPSGGTATTVQGTSGQIGVNTVGNTATVSLDTAITGAITANTAKIGISTAQASAITTNTAKVGITTAQATAITNNTAKTGITTAQSDAITANTAKVSVSGLNQVGGAIIASDSVLYYDGSVPRRKVFSSVPLSIMNNDANFITGITKANVDTAIGSGTLTTDYYASDKTWKTIPSGGTATTVLGTTGEIDVNTVGSNATVSISSTITDAIDLNTAKQSVAGLNQVGAAVLSTDSMVYYAGTALAPRRKTFSLVPNSIFNNDSGFTTNTGTVTSVTGTTNQINVANGTTTPAISLNNTITSAITANTAKTGITTAQASAIVANTAKVSNVDILPLNNTFTGVNVFNNASGGVQVDRITAVGDADTYIGYDFANVIQFAVDDTVIGEFSAVGGGQFTTSGAIALVSGTLVSGLYLGLNNGIIQGNLTTTDVNSSRVDRDFVIRKQTTGDALTYDAGTDTLTASAANIVGFGGGGGETGTWTPVFDNSGGVASTTTNTYSKSGQTVTLWWYGDLNVGTGTGPLALTAASLPFGIASDFGTFTLTSCGTYANSSPTVDEFGMVRLFSAACYFSRASDGVLLNGNALLTSSFSFTMTYQTDD